MGLLSVSIVKDRGRSYSNGGVSDRFDEALLVHPVGPWDETYRPEVPRVMVVPGAAGTARAVVVQPTPDGGYAVDRRADQVGPMFGGTFIHASDGRFVEAVEAVLGSKFYGALPLHDRYETPEQYASYD